MIDGKFYTKDLACAAFLKTEGHDLFIKKERKKGVFYYAPEIQSEVDAFFNGKGKYQEYASNMRLLKSQIANIREEEVST